MKLIFSLALFIFFVSVAFSQPRDTSKWAPAGASWIYSVPAVGQELYYQFDYKGDTVVQNLPMKKIEQSSFNFPIPVPGVLLPRTPNVYVNTLLFYQNEDSVFWYDDNKLQLLYVFETPVGGRWVIEQNVHYDCSGAAQAPRSTDTITIASSSYTTISGHQLLEMRLAQCTEWYIGYSLLKNIGSLTTFVPQPAPPRDCPTDGNVQLYQWLACYTDSTRGTIATSWVGSNGCERLILPTQKLQTETHDKILIYPNPTNGIVGIMAPLQLIKNIEIFDINGRLVQAVQNPNAAIDVHHLNPGVYVLVMHFEHSIPITQKLIKL